MNAKPAPNTANQTGQPPDRDDDLPDIADLTAPPLRKVGTSVSQETFDALNLARSRDRIDTLTRVRILLEIWRHDPQLQAKVVRLARHVKAL